MSLPLNPETLAAAYDFLRTTPPFNGWNLPEGDDLTFKVIKDPALRGSYRRDRKNRHVISISAASIGFTESLVETMSHEMIHLHEALTGLETAAQHGAAFHKYADQVCKVHGFDRKLF